MLEWLLDVLIVDKEAKMDVRDRTERMAAVVRRLESDLHLLCLTGVEDRLQVSCWH